MLVKNTKEFSKYGNFKLIVEEMVNYDNEVYVKPFYESLSGKITVEYIDNFWDALNKIKKSKKSIIATRIEIVNQDHLNKSCSCNQKFIICKNNSGDKFSSHAVSLFKNKSNGRIYMFDPNGVFYKNEHQWLYKSKNGNNLLESKDFEKEYDLDLPKFSGVQSLCQFTDPTYIDYCGFCMFYNFIGIKYVMDKLESGYRKDITSLIKTISDKEQKKQKDLYKIFPKDDDLGPLSLKIITNIFSTKKDKN